MYARWPSFRNLILLTILNFHHTIQSPLYNKLLVFTIFFFKFKKFYFLYNLQFLFFLFKHCSKLHDLIETVVSLRRSLRLEDLAAEARAKAEIRNILGNRKKLLLEVGRMVRLGRLLRTRLKEPLCHQRQVRQRLFRKRLGSRIKKN